MWRLILLIPAALLLAVPVAAEQNESGLRSDIDRGRASERALSSAATRLGALERAASREVALMEERVAAARAELGRAEEAARRAADRLVGARRRVGRLRTRLGEVREQLAENLRQRYVGSRPDLMTVIVESGGFSELLETVEFLRTIEERNTMILDIVRDARTDAGRQRRRLTVLSARRREAVTAVRGRNAALVIMAAGLRSRRDTLTRARAAKAAALSSVRSRRRAAQRELAALLEERRKAAMVPGPGGPWAIPWPIVQCESGGQNLPPNFAGASGYYQFMPATWRGLGGSTPHAYQASKAEQDRLAAQLWAGGAGARNWVCASLV